MSNLRVLIVGASIAGPTAAYWLARTGATVTVIERFPELRRGGQNVDIRTAGLTIMRRTPGMEEAVRAALFELEGLSFVREDGSPIAVMKAAGNSDSQFLVSEYEILRGELSKVIHDLGKDDERIKYIFGEQIASMRQDQDDGPVTVEFANGTATSEYDLVVACDGATSRTRALGFECGVRDHIIPLNTWAAYLTISEDLTGGSLIGKAYTAVGGRFVATAAAPGGGTMITLMRVLPRGDIDATATFREASQKGEEALKSFVDKEFRGAGWLTDQILDGMMKSDNFYGTEWVQVKMPNLHKGRFVVVGDAGYAAGPTGNGTSLAIAGAYILAGEIGRHEGNVSAGLKAYEERMAPIVKDMQVIPPGIPAAMAPQTAWGIWIRNQVFRVICFAMKFRGLFSFLSGFLASSFGKDKYNIPDYEWQT